MNALRSRLWSRTSEFVHSSSGSQSTNDSGVALLSEKTRFQPIEGSSSLLSSFFRDGGPSGNGPVGDKGQGGIGTNMSASAFGVGKSRESLYEVYGAGTSAGGHVQEYLNKMAQATASSNFQKDESSFKAGKTRQLIGSNYTFKGNSTLLILTFRKATS
jgi:hypothetical protein